MSKEEPEPTIDGWPLWSGLPKPEPEPVGYFYQGRFSTEKDAPGIGIYGVPVYTTPPKKEWVGFTQEEHQFAMRTDSSFFAGFLYAEKLLKEKNT